MNTLHRLRCVALLGALWSLSLTVQAQVQRAPPSGVATPAQSGQLQQLQQQLVEASAARSQLQSENDRLKADNEALKKQLDAAKGGAAALAQKAAALEANAARSGTANRDAQEANEHLREQMSDLIGRFRGTAQQLKDSETANNKNAAALAERDAQYKSCTERNVQLYQLSNEVITRLETQGFWTAVARTEPFTRIARTRMENLALDYQSRADAARQP
jgi:chromosome segregation ATPase